MRAWLFDQGSLTRRLQQLSSRDFRVEIVAQGYGRALPGESRALGVDPASLCIVRRVYLRGCGERWVYARTVIPVASLAGSARRLASLGSRPLGAALFADPSMERGPVEAARVSEGSRLHAEIFAGLREAAGPVWGRRSVFRLGGRPLLVSEFFLPALVEAQR